MIKKTINSKPLKKILSLLNNKYKFEIIYYLSFQKMRFGEIKENLGVITQQLLTKQLKQMEGNNLIIRKKYDGFPRKVEYSLTTLGCSLKPLVEVMLKWEKNNSKKINYLLKKKILDSIYDYY
jgi:DNA-binding HxlR family transcriptional regulator